MSGPSLRTLQNDIERMPKDQRDHIEYLLHRINEATSTVELKREIKPMIEEELRHSDIRINLYTIPRSRRFTRNSRSQPDIVEREEIAKLKSWKRYNKAVKMLDNLADKNIQDFQTHTETGVRETESRTGGNRKTNKKLPKRRASRNTRRQ